MEERLKLMTITHLQITIKPWNIYPSMKELHIETIANGICNKVVIPFDENDFESRFDFMMDRAKLEIKSLIKNHEKKQPTI